MKLTFEPSGGRWGHGFNYYCAECEEYLGNSDVSDVVTHAATTTTGMFKKTIVPVNCVNAGKSCELPKHLIEATEINPK